MGDHLEAFTPANPGRSGTVIARTGPRTAAIALAPRNVRRSGTIARRATGAHDVAMQKMTPFLMFTGRAEEAIQYYVETFERSSIQSLRRYGPGEMGPEGSVSLAHFTLAGQEVMAIDSPAKHAFDFTPSISMFVTFSTEPELDRAHQRLSEGGSVMMPLQEYPFSPKFSWVGDRFGVSWQLSLVR